MKTAKFSEVVRKCGEPSIYLAWVDPARDRTLKRALTEHRVMTLHQELHGGKKDSGSVGFLKDRNAQRLVFPKSLRRFSDRKVIAIDYSLIAKDPAGGDAIPADQAKKESARVHSNPPVRPAARGQKRKIAITKNQAIARSKPRRTENVRLEKPGPRAVDEILTEVKRAVAELSAGKSVPAYDRLKRLLETARPWDPT